MKKKYTRFRLKKFNFIKESVAIAEKIWIRTSPNTKYSHFEFITCLIDFANTHVSWTKYKGTREISIKGKYLNSIHLEYVKRGIYEAIHKRIIEIYLQTNKSVKLKSQSIDSSFIPNKRGIHKHNTNTDETNEIIETDDEIVNNEVIDFETDYDIDNDETEKTDEQSKTKPSKTKPSKTKPSKTKTSTTKPLETKTSKTKSSKTKPSKTKTSKTKQSKTKPSKTKQSKTKPSETKPSKTKTSKTKPSKTKQINNNVIGTVPFEKLREYDNHKLIENNRYNGRKKYIKISHLVDTNGAVLANHIFSGKTSDFKSVEGTFDHLNIDLGTQKYSNNNRNKQYFLADSGYDSKKIKDFVTAKGYTPIIKPNNRNKKEANKIYLSTKQKVIYRKRQIVENSFAWTKDYPVVNQIYEKTISSYFGLLSLVNSVILAKKITKEHNEIKSRCIS